MAGAAERGHGVTGALLAAGGWAWMVWALFRAAGTPVRPSETPLQLGAALGLGAPLLAVSALLFAVVVNAVHIPDEEVQMARRFGGWYRDYVSGARRWL